MVATRQPQSRRRGSNPRPVVYKTTALPTELLRRSPHSTPRRVVRIADVLPDWKRSGDRALLQDLARALVRVDLPLDPLERVVDRLRVAAETLGHLLVGRAFEIQAQRVRLRAAKGPCRDRRRGSAAPRSRSRRRPGRSRASSGSASPRVHSPSGSWPAGVWLNEM